MGCLIAGVTIKAGDEVLSRWSDVYNVPASGAGLASDHSGTCRL